MGFGASSPWWNWSGAAARWREPMDGRWLRRARPGLGTLIEVGLAVEAGGGAIDHQRAIEAAFRSIGELEGVLSRFLADSDVARFHALPVGTGLTLRPDGVAVFAAADQLRSATDGLFDITLGGAPDGWRLDG